MSNNYENYVSSIFYNNFFFIVLYFIVNNIESEEHVTNSVYKVSHLRNVKDFLHFLRLKQNEVLQDVNVSYFYLDKVNWSVIHYQHLKHTS